MRKIEIELIWFEGCPNHLAARELLEQVVSALAPGATIRVIDATDPVDAERLRFPGSPTIRVNGRDVDPNFEDPADYTPRCRIYHTVEGVRGVPERAWIEAAIAGSDPTADSVQVRVASTLT